MLQSGRVRVGGEVEKNAKRTLQPDDTLDVLQKSMPTGLPTGVSVLHEDDDVIVVLKSQGLLTVATERERETTAQAYLNAYLGARREERVHVVHRLDRETSGVLVFAKSMRVKRALQEQFERRAVERVYVAVVEGQVTTPMGTLRSRLREGPTLAVRSTRNPHAGREAITHYRVVERGPTTTVLELRLTTGRRGQIRAQLAEIGHPIVGDVAYGSRRRPLRRICLHATRLGFEHPRGGHVSFESPPPAAFRHAR
jgi:23S rRNA pseudouridine1911/1915/1917 synthase